MSTPLTSQQRTARYRARQRGQEPPLPTCPQCSRLLLSTRTAPLCSRCWRLSPDGRKWNRQRIAAARARRAAAAGAE
jgi:ribosomal protein L32